MPLMMVSEVDKASTISCIAHYTVANLGVKRGGCVVRTVSRAGYRGYINSIAWQEVRARYWQSKLPKTCFVCGTDQGPLELHHRTYKRLGCERLTDLLPVCRSCHELTHKVHKARGKSLWRAGVIARRVLKHPRGAEAILLN